MLRLLADTDGAEPRLVSLHSRGAEREVLDELERHGVGTVVFHWFSGPLPVLEAAIEGGHYFSVNAAMLDSAAGREKIARIPLDRLLTETDAPYARHNRRPLRPGSVETVLRHYAARWHRTENEAAAAVEANFHRLLKSK